MKLAIIAVVVIAAAILLYKRVFGNRGDKVPHVTIR